jgi:hypothetical protein
MKISKISLIIVMMLGSLIGTNAFGQTTEKKPEKSKSSATAPAKPRMTQAERINNIATKLGLNDDQKSKLKAVFQDESKAMKELRASSEFSSLTAPEKRAKLAKIRQDANQKVTAFLTDDQKAKWKELQPQGRPNRRRSS